MASGSADFVEKRTSGDKMSKKWQKLLSDLAIPCSRLISVEALDATTATTIEIKGLECISQIRSIAASVDTQMLQYKPVNPSKLWATSFCAPIYEHKHLFEMSVFGLRFTGDSIPLHDHPKMYGFIRPLHGRVRISSFSWLDSEEENKLVEEKHTQSEGMNSHVNIVKRPAKYEGQLILTGSCKDPPIAVLGPHTANLHMIEALEDGATFFDLLVPGYRNNRNCTYYSIIGQKEPTTIGEIVWLEGSEDVPEYFTMQQLKLDPFQTSC